MRYTNILLEKFPWASINTLRDTLLNQRKRVFGEKDCVVWMQNSYKKFVSRLLEHQPQVKGVGEKEIVWMDAWCHWLFANACEIKSHFRTDHYLNTDIPKADRISCLVDGSYKSYVKSEWLPNHLISYRIPMILSNDSSFKMQTQREANLSSKLPAKLWRSLHCDSKMNL